MIQDQEEHKVKRLKKKIEFKKLLEKKDNLKNLQKLM